MKHFFQISLIISVSFVGELLNYLIPLPIPGSIYGLVIMLILLLTHTVRVDQVKSTGDWLISLMPVMFVGPTVGLMDSFESYKNILIPLCVISVVSTIITMVVTGRAAQRLIQVQEKKEMKKNAQ